VECGTGAGCSARARSACSEVASLLCKAALACSEVASLLCKAAPAWRQEAGSRLDPARRVVRQPPQPRETPQHAPQRSREAQPPAPHRHFTNRRVPLYKSASAALQIGHPARVGASARPSGQSFKLVESARLQVRGIKVTRLVCPIAKRCGLGFFSCHSPGGPQEARARQGAGPFAPRAPGCLCRRPLDNLRCSIRLLLHAARRSLSR